MIDLHTVEAELIDYVRVHYAHLSPPWSAGLRMRMRLISVPEAERLQTRGEPEVTSWLDTKPDRLSSEDAFDRARGAMLGMAVGDAIGTTLEFQARDGGHAADMVGGGPFRLAPGQFPFCPTCSFNARSSSSQPRA